MFMFRSAIRLFYDYVLNGVNKTAREVTGFGGLKSGIGFAFASAVSGDEVFKDREAVFKVGFYGKLDSAAARIGDEAFHAAKLCDLPPVTAGSGIDHEVNIVRKKIATDGQPVQDA